MTAAPLTPAAYDRILARIEAAVFNEPPPPVLGVVREHVRSCERCGTKAVFHGSDVQWRARQIVFADTHDCGDVA